MQFFSADATIIFLFAHNKFKKPPLKVAQKNSNPLFFLNASTAQMAQTEEFMFQNMAYRPIVYKTGGLKQVFKVTCLAQMFTILKASFSPNCSYKRFFLHAFLPFSSNGYF